MNLTALLAQQFTLPSIPKVVALLLSEFDRPELDLRRVTHHISTDVALTTRLLQIANSGFFRLSGQIHSVSEALALMDVSQVRAMAAQAAEAASPKAVPGIRLQQFWLYSLHVARVARSLAGLVRLNQQAAFTCGLIHGIGELAMHLAMPQTMEGISSRVGPLDMRRAEAEREALGYCYATVGAGFAHMWQFPAMMVDALEHQYAPFESNVYEPLAGVIHLATWRARAKVARLNEKGLAVTYPDTVGVALDLDVDTVLQQDPFDWAAHV